MKIMENYILCHMKFGETIPGTVAIRVLSLLPLGNAGVMLCITFESVRSTLKLLNVLA